MNWNQDLEEIPALQLLMSTGILKIQNRAILNNQDV